MENTKQHLESLSEIKNLMERSTKFLSLSGMSGIIAGITALAGAFLAYQRIHHYLDTSSLDYTRIVNKEVMNKLLLELVGIGIMVLVISIVVGIYLTIRESKKNNQSIWDKTSKLLLTNLMIPLVTGGLFCLILIFHNHFALVGSATLIFYGLALVNCSKYTLNGIKYLGLSEIALGLLSALFIGNGIFFWAIGFGILHIVYGSLMHLKYNRKAPVSNLQ